MHACSQYLAKHALQSVSCVGCRLMQEYEDRRNTEGDLTEQDMPAQMLAAVEAQQNEEDRYMPFASLSWPSVRSYCCLMLS